MEKLSGRWTDLSTIGSHNYTCGYCGKDISSNKGYYTSDTHYTSYVCICHHCNRASFIDDEGNVFPGAVYGDNVSHLPNKEIELLFLEARSCISCNAFTASVLCSRKLLMNIAVSKGAEEGLSFIKYIEFLSESGYLPPDGKVWVDHIRKKGNQATHEITIMTKEDAIELIEFMSMLLKFVFEFPALIKIKK